MSIKAKIISCDSTPEDHLEVRVAKGTVYLSIKVLDPAPGPSSVYLDSPSKLRELADIFIKAATEAEWEEKFNA